MPSIRKTPPGAPYEGGRNILCDPLEKQQEHDADDAAREDEQPQWEKPRIMYLFHSFDRLLQRQPGGDPPGQLIDHHDLLQIVGPFLDTQRLGQRIIVQGKNNDRGSDENLGIFNTIVRSDAQHRIFNTVCFSSTLQQHLPAIDRNEEHIAYKIFAKDFIWSFYNLKFATHTAHLD